MLANFRSIWVRLGLSMLAMLFLLVGGYTGLGWLLHTQPRWLVSALGEDRLSRWFLAYARSLGTLFPKDSDGDGVADSVEEFFGTDPQNPENHPDLMAVLATPGFLDWSAGVTHFAYFGEGARVARVFVEPGERLRIRARLGFSDGPGVFSRGMSLRVTPRPPALVAVPGGVPSETPVRVPVDRDQIFEFDLLIPVNADASHPFEEVLVGFENWVSTYSAGSLAFGVVRKKAPVACTATEMPHSDPLWKQAPQWLPEGRVVRLSWPAQNDADMLSVEATCDTSGRVWMPVALCGHGQTGGVFSYLPDRSRRWGSPKFRVVPLEVPPPEN